MNDENQQQGKGTARAQDEQGSGSASPSEIELLKKELEQMTEMAKRTMADLQNYKRRQEEERRIIITMANAQLILGLLPILDNLERAVKHAPDPNALPENTKEWFNGINISIGQFQKILEETGLKAIESAGQKFNPEFHEALTSGPGEKDIVVEELEKGYILGDKVIRHAKVKVGNGETLNP